MPDAAGTHGTEVTLKLFASLGDYLPAELDGNARRHNELAVRIDEDTTVQALMDRFRVPAAMAHLVLVNGVFVPRHERAARRLCPGDCLAVWPPIAGG